MAVESVPPWGVAPVPPVPAAGSSASLNVPMALRLKVAYAAGAELDAIADHVRAQVTAMITAESSEQETIAFALLDRAKLLAHALMAAGSVDDDDAQDPAELAAVMRLREEEGGDHVHA